MGDASKLDTISPTQKKLPKLIARRNGHKSDQLEVSSTLLFHGQNPAKPQMFTTRKKRKINKKMNQRRRPKKTRKRNRCIVRFELNLIYKTKSKHEHSKNTIEVLKRPTIIHRDQHLA